MKTVLIIIDGMSDEPIPALGNTTPLESSYTPHLNYISTRGQVGRMVTSFSDFPIESMVCIMGLLGYEPAAYYPTGRASFEALAKGIHLSEDDLVFRCNTVTVDPQTEVLTDFTAGLISDTDARRIIGQIDLPPGWELYPGQSYRNTLVLRNAKVAAKDIICSEPHMHIGRLVSDMPVRAKNQGAEDLVARINAFLIGSRNQISSMRLPASCKANMLWTWSPSIKPDWPAFHDRTGLNAAVVGGLDFLHGIAMAAQIHYDLIPGATGYIDTDYDAKARFAVQYIRNFDFVLVHVNAADEEAHQRNFIGKRDVIERVDRLILGPLLQSLHENYREDFRIAVCADHMTRSRDGKHTDTPVPFAVYGKGIRPSGVFDFSERRCDSLSSIGSLRFIPDVLLENAP